MGQYQTEKMTASVSVVPKQSFQCLCQHFATFYAQSILKRPTNFGEPCRVCVRNSECNFDWMELVLPYLGRTDVEFNMVDPAQMLATDSDHRSLNGNSY